MQPDIPGYGHGQLGAAFAEILASQLVSRYYYVLRSSTRVPKNRQPFGKQQVSNNPNNDIIKVRGSDPGSHHASALNADWTAQDVDYPAGAMEGDKEFVCGAG